MYSLFNTSQFFDSQSADLFKLSKSSAYVINETSFPFETQDVTKWDLRRQNTIAVQTRRHNRTLPDSFTRPVQQRIQPDLRVFWFALQGCCTYNITLRQYTNYMPSRRICTSNWRVKSPAHTKRANNWWITHCLRIRKNSSKGEQSISATEPYRKTKLVVWHLAAVSNVWPYKHF